MRSIAFLLAASALVQGVTAQPLPNALAAENKTMAAIESQSGLYERMREQLMMDEDLVFAEMAKWWKEMAAQQIPLNAGLGDCADALFALDAIQKDKTHYAYQIQRHTLEICLAAQWSEYPMPEACQEKPWPDIEIMESEDQLRLMNYLADERSCMIEKDPRSLRFTRAEMEYIIAGNTANIDTNSALGRGLSGDRENRLALSQYMQDLHARVQSQLQWAQDLTHDIFQTIYTSGPAPFSLLGDTNTISNLLLGEKFAPPVTTFLNQSDTFLLDGETYQKELEEWQQERETSASSDSTSAEEQPDQNTLIGAMHRLWLAIDETSSVGSLAMCYPTEPFIGPVLNGFSNPAPLGESSLTSAGGKAVVIPNAYQLAQSEQAQNLNTAYVGLLQNVLSQSSCLEFSATQFDPRDPFYQPVRADEFITAIRQCQNEDRSPQMNELLTGLEAATRIENADKKHNEMMTWLSTMQGSFAEFNAQLDELTALLEHLSTKTQTYQ